MWVFLLDINSIDKVGLDSDEASLTIVKVQNSVVSELSAVSVEQTSIGLLKFDLWIIVMEFFKKCSKIRVIWVGFYLRAVVTILLNVLTINRKLSLSLDADLVVSGRDIQPSSDHDSGLSVERECLKKMYK